MANRLVWYVGNRNPPISENITVDGDAFDLSGSTVKLKMRAVGSSTLKVNTAATIDSAAAGTVHYDWATADVDTAGEFLVWWEVTTGSKVQDVGETVIEIRSHAPQTNAYVELEQFKSTADLQATNFMDGDIQLALLAGSRAVDKICQRRFWADEDADNARYYSPVRRDRLYIDDLITLTTLKTDSGGDGTYEDTWTTSDYVLLPLNAATDGEPYTEIQLHPLASLYFPIEYPKTVELTGKFGWSAVPPEIKEATTILAGRFLKRSREAPFGDASALALGGAAVRLTGKDADVVTLLGDFVRYPILDA